MKSFTNAEFLVEWPETLAVAVTDRATGKTYRGNGAFAVEVAGVCRQPDPHERLRYTVKHIWKRDECKAELDDVLDPGKVADITYQASGAGGTASLYRMVDDSWTVLCRKYAVKPFSVGFAGRNEARKFAEEWAVVADTDTGEKT